MKDPRAQEFLGVINQAYRLIWDPSKRLNKLRNAFHCGFERTPKVPKNTHPVSLAGGPNQRPDNFHYLSMLERSPAFTRTALSLGEPEPTDPTGSPRLLFNHEKD